MRKSYNKLAQKLTSSLTEYDAKHHLPGIKDSVRLTVFVEQLIESIHRVKYVSVLKTQSFSTERLNPNSNSFDPVRAAIIHSQKDNLNEAFWLTFLLTHFGRHKVAGWQYLKDVYGRLGSGKLWDWQNVSKNTGEFREWLSRHQEYIRERKRPNGFGNHRKYQSLDAYSPRGTGATIESYVKWVGPTRNHKDLIEHAYQESGNDPKEAFDILYKSMGQVVGFGRTGRFDYLTMIGHMGLADILPGRAYLQNSTGPIDGAKLLFIGRTKRRIQTKDLENLLLELDNELGVGMQVLEDALCNWQKSPERFIKFRG